MRLVFISVGLRPFHLVVTIGYFKLEELGLCGAGKGDLQVLAG
jgi:hypothetical protein